MTHDKRAVKELTEQWWYGSPTPQEISSFLWRAMQYIKDRRPFELATIAILNEKCYDVMDVEIGRRYMWWSSAWDR